MTATEKYAEKKADINFKLLLIQQKLMQHKKEHLLKPRHWGYVEELQKIDSELESIVQFLKAQ